MGAGHTKANFSQEQLKKLDSGKPILLPGGIKITKNKQTGMLEGVPEEWTKNYDLPFSIDHSKTSNTSKLP